MTQIQSASSFELDTFTIERDRNVIRRGEDESRLEPKVMGVLCILAEADGNVVSRTDLIDAVWGVEHGGDESLTRAISLLRATFKKSDPRANLIETVPRTGYRLIVKAEPASAPIGGGTESLGSPRQTHAPHDQSYGEDDKVPHPVVYLAMFGLIAMFVLATSFLRPSSSTETSPQTPQSIVVLPFDNLSPDPDMAYFSRGISEEILNTLAGIDGLRVIGRTSSFAIKDQVSSVDQIRSILGVDHILDGSVRVSGERVRITAQLVDALNGDQVWSESYDRELNDAFTIQAEIATIVRDRLYSGLSEETAPQISAAAMSPPDFETYQTYLEGVEAFRRRYIMESYGAVEILSRVVEAEPDFIPARAHLSAAHSVAAIIHLEVGRFDDARESQIAARDAAAIVLEKDPDNSLALAALGGIHFQNAEFIESRRYYERAIESNPSDETPAMFLQVLLKCTGDAVAARDVLERAQFYNPTASSLNRGLALSALNAGEYEEALGHARLAADYGAEQGLYLAALASIMLGDLEAAEQYARAFDIAETEIEDRWRVRALEAGVDPSTRQDWIDSLRATRNIGEQALIRFWGEDDVANELLTAASGPNGYMRRQPLPVSQAWLPTASGYRSSDAFRAVVERWNLPEYWREYGFPENCKSDDLRGFECK